MLAPRQKGYETEVQYSHPGTRFPSSTMIVWKTRRIVQCPQDAAVYPVAWRQWYIKPSKRMLLRWL